MASEDIKLLNQQIKQLKKEKTILVEALAQVTYLISAIMDDISEDKKGESIKKGNELQFHVNEALSKAVTGV